MMKSRIKKGYMEKGTVELPEPVIDEELLNYDKVRYEANKSKLNEAIGFAKLDNNAEISPRTSELLEKMIRGELTPEEVRERLNPNYKSREI